MVYYQITSSKVMHESGGRKKLIITSFFHCVLFICSLEYRATCIVL